MRNLYTNMNGKRKRESDRKTAIMTERKLYAKYYNRKFKEQKNSIENAFLKFKTMQFYYYLLEAEIFSSKTIEILRRRKEEKVR